jgi:hypothetical protein
VVGEVQAGLKKRLKKLKEWLSKKLKKNYQQPIRAWGFMGVSFG